MLRPEAIEALRGSELILHAGDVGKPEILDELRKIAPVVAIRGNVDTGVWCSMLNETELVETASATFYLIHSITDLDLDPVTAGVHIILSGHTHHPKQFTKDGVLYINPGSAGPRRFNLPVTVGRLTLGIPKRELEIIPLGVFT